MPDGVLWDYFAVHTAMYAHVAWGYWLWGFDVLIAFSVTFALFYGLFVFMERLLPSRLGARPRVWAVPLVGVGATGCFFVFMDHAVTATLRDGWNALALPVQPWIWTLAVAWGFGGAVALGRVAVRAARINRATRRLPTAPDDPVFRAARSAGGARGRVALKIGAAGTPVFSCGLFAAYVVVPADFDVCHTPDERFAILLHEGVHLRHRDAWTLLALAAARAVFWFDPVMRHAIGRIKADLERRCDWTVVHTHRQDAAEYAALIVKTVRARRTLTAGFSDDYRQLAHRLGHILRDDTIPPPRRLSRAGALGLAIIVCGSLAGFTLYAGRPGTTPTNPSYDDYRAMLAEAEKSMGLAPRPDSIPGVTHFRARFGLFGGYTQVTAQKDKED